jgi:hypothetical protein
MPCTILVSFGVSLNAAHLVALTSSVFFFSVARFPERAPPFLASKFSARLSASIFLLFGLGEILLRGGLGFLEACPPWLSIQSAALTREPFTRGRSSTSACGRSLQGCHLHGAKFSRYFKHSPDRLGMKRRCLPASGGTEVFLGARRSGSVCDQGNPAPAGFRKRPASRMQACSGSMLLCCDGAVSNKHVWHQDEERASPIIGAIGAVTLRRTSGTRPRVRRCSRASRFATRGIREMSNLETYREKALKCARAANGAHNTAQRVELLGLASIYRALADYVDDRPAHGPAYRVDEDQDTQNTIYYPSRRYAPKRAWILALPTSLVEFGLIVFLALAATQFFIWLAMRGPALLERSSTWRPTCFLFSCETQAQPHREARAQPEPKSQSQLQPQALLQPQPQPQAQPQIQPRPPRHQPPPRPRMLDGVVVGDEPQRHSPIECWRDRSVRGPCFD